MFFLLRVFLIGMTTLIFPLERCILGEKEFEAALLTALSEKWRELLSENQSLLEQDEKIIELLVWNMTESFLLFPHFRERLAQKLIKLSLHKWRWERAVGGFNEER